MIIMPKRIAAIGDLHVRDTPPAGLREILSAVYRQADILLICGDLTDRGLASEAQVLADELRSCPIPLLGVLGNHDFEKGQQDEVKRILKGAGFMFLEDGPHEVDDIGFAGAKGFGGGFDNHLLQAWGEDAVKAFARESVDE